MKTKPRFRVIGTSKRFGFTLVEVIVVLVILAILAALLIPSLTGYIEKARQKRIIMETRQGVMAAQTLFDEIYASDLTMSNPKCDKVLDLFADKLSSIDELYNLAELDKKKGTIENVSTDATGKIATLTWRLKSGTTCTYDSTKDNPYTISSGSGLDSEIDDIDSD